MARIIKEKIDLRFLDWSHIRHSSGTAGTFLKSESNLNGIKKYYKLSNFDQEKGIIGHECINEIIVDRLLTILEVPHLMYELIHAEIEIEGKAYQTYLCASEDFKMRGESKVALDDYYLVNAKPGESHYDFCVRLGWQKYIDQMIAVDYLILNRDRHGANIEVLRNARAHTMRIAPLFDHGLSFLYSCYSDAEAKAFDVMADRHCNNFVGSRSCFENLGLIAKKQNVFPGKLKADSKSILFADLEEILSETFRDQIWSMLYERYQIYENVCHNR